MNELVLPVHAALPIVVTGVMPFMLTGLSKSKGFGSKENERTRAWQAELTGWRQRAYWAHQNAFEALPLFAAMTILAYITHPASLVAAAAAWAFVGLRVAYAACYLADTGRLRSIVWFMTQLAVLALLLVSLSVIG
jgi:uncharacterized MAPEG superfamily protein